MSAQRELGFEIITETPAASDEHAGLNWSYSRRESVDQCNRRYFFQYYSDALEDAELRTRVQFLKGLKNRYLRTGELVHLVVGTYFKKLKQGKTLSEDWLTKWAREIFDEDQKYSLHIRAGGSPTNRQYPPVLLDEIVNQVDGHSELLALSGEQMLSAVQRFFRSEVFSEFRALGASPKSYIERKFSLPGFPARVSGKLDLAVKNESSATIVDWKIGAGSDGGAESLQLATYGLWAAVEFEVSERNLRIAKAHLLSQEVVEFKADEQAFANARVRILQDLDRMVILHRYGKLGVIDAFTPNPHKGVCRLCPFRGVCPEGEAIINA